MPDDEPQEPEPEQAADPHAERLGRFVSAVDGIEALQLAAAARIAEAVKGKLERGELPTREEMRQLDDAKRALCDGIAGMLRSGE